MDKTKLHSLAPYARVLFVMICGGFTSGYITAEENRKDSLIMGYKDGLDTPYGYFKKSFLLFRGVLMPFEWLK